MVLANFYQNRFFRNRHPTNFTICLSLPFWRLYPALSTIFLVTTSLLIPQLYIFHFGSCSFLYVEPFYITSPDRGLWWGPSPQPWCTQTPWMCFLCLNSTLPKFLPTFSVSMLSQLSSWCQLLSLRTHQTSPPPCHSMQTSPFQDLYTWLPLASAGTSRGFFRVNLEGRVVLLEGKGD